MNKSFTGMKVAAPSGVETEGESVEEVTMVRRLAKDHSAALAILCHHTVLRWCSEDPFAEVKVLITVVINNLQAEASCEAKIELFVDVLADSMSTAQNELHHIRHAESNNAHSFAMLGQSLEDCSHEVKAAAGDTHLRGFVVIQVHDETKKQIEAKGLENYVFSSSFVARSATQLSADVETVVVACQI